MDPLKPHRRMRQCFAGAEFEFLVMIDNLERIGVETLKKTCCDIKRRAAVPRRRKTMRWMKQNRFLMIVAGAPSPATSATAATIERR
jgi:uridylate kinase